MTLFYCISYISLTTYQLIQCNHYAMNLKEKRHIWLPLVLFIYFAIMAWNGRDMITVHHKYGQYFGIMAAEIIILILLSIFLKKKNQLRIDRRSLKKRTDDLIEENKQQDSSNNSKIHD